MKKINVLSLLFVLGLSLAAFSSFSQRVDAGCWYDGNDGYQYWDEDCTETAIEEGYMMEAFVVESTSLKPFFESWPDAPEPEDPCLWSNCITSVVILPDLSLQWQPLVVEPIVPSREIIITIVSDDWGGGGGGGGGGVPTTLDICIVPGACPAPVIEIPTVQFDACPNIDDIQSDIPTGMVKDDNFNCVYRSVVPFSGTPIQICQDNTATNFGRPLPCNYPDRIITTVVPQTEQTCQNRTATNFGGSLPCNYSGPDITICQDPNASNQGSPLPCTKTCWNGNIVAMTTVCPVETKTCLNGSVIAKTADCPTTVQPTCQISTAANFGDPLPCRYSNDVCLDVSGLQTSVPADRRKNTSTGNCDLIVVPPATGPSAILSVSPPSVAEGGSVSFSASGVKGSSIIVEHRLYVSTNQTAGWQGAGPESSSVSGSLNTIPRNPRVFNGPGSYSVIYEVKDLNGRIGSASRSVSVTPAVCVGPGCGPVLPPVAAPVALPANADVSGGEPISGCMNTEAYSYNRNATKNDESMCNYAGFTLSVNPQTVKVRSVAGYSGMTEQNVYIYVNPVFGFNVPVSIGFPSSSLKPQFSLNGGTFTDSPNVVVEPPYNPVSVRIRFNAKLSKNNAENFVLFDGSATGAVCRKCTREASAVLQLDSRPLYPGFSEI